MPSGPSSKVVPMQEFDIVNFVSRHYYPWVIVRGLAAVSEWKDYRRLRRVNLKGQLKPGLLLGLRLTLLQQLLQLLLRLQLRIQHWRAGQPRRSSPLICSRWQRDRRPGMNMSWKFTLWVVFKKKDAFRSLGIHTGRRPRGPGVRLKGRFLSLYSM